MIHQLTQSNVFRVMEIKQFSSVKQLKHFEKIRETDHSNDDLYRLLYFTEGMGVIRLHQKAVALKMGETYVFNPNHEAVQIEFMMENTQLICIDFYSLQLHKEQNEWQIETAPLPVVGKIKVSPPSIIAHRIEQLLECWNVKKGDDYATQISFIELWRTLLSGSEQGGVSSDSATSLQRIQQLIDSHYMDEFQVEEMARSSGMSPSVFFQSFKKHTSFSPLQYVTHKKMDKAKDLLTLEQMKVNDVAKMVGYQNIAYFSRAFKKAVGASPIHYTKALRTKIAVLHPAFWGDLLAIGVPPECLIPLWNQESQKSHYAQMETRGFDITALKNNRPDIIIGTNKNSIWQEQLIEVAPVHFIPFKSFTWREHFRQLASFIGAEKVADRWLDLYDLRVEMVRERIYQNIHNEAVLAARISPDGVRVFGANRRKVGELLYGDLQIKPPAGTEAFSFLDVETVADLKQYNAEHILLFQEREIMKSEKTDLTGKVHYASIFPWFHYSALGHEQALNDALLHFAST